MPNETKGRKNNQKMKPYLVYQYLLHNSDENNVVTANEIVEHIKEYGIDAERRGIYKDIEEINKATQIWVLFFFVMLQHLLFFSKENTSEWYIENGVNVTIKM